MEELERQLKELLKKSGSDSETIKSIQAEESIAPFSTVNRLMAYLLATGKIGYGDYKQLGDEYLKRHQQQNQFFQNKVFHECREVC